MCFWNRRFLGLGRNWSSQISKSQKFLQFFKRSCQISRQNFTTTHGLSDSLVRLVESYTTSLRKRQLDPGNPFNSSKSDFGPKSIFRFWSKIWWFWSDFWPFLRPLIERVLGVQLHFCLARFEDLDETNKAVRKGMHYFEVLSKNFAPRKSA